MTTELNSYVAIKKSLTKKLMDIPTDDENDQVPNRLDLLLAQ